MSSYEIDGKKLPSVTTIISDCTDKSGALTQWAANMVCEYIRQNSFIDTKDEKYIVSEDVLNSARFNYKDVSKEALDVGSEVHNAIEQSLLGHPTSQIIDGLSGQAANGFGAFLVWAKDVDLVPIKIEQTVCSDRWAGTLDFNGTMDGKRFVVDWKSSKAIYPEYRIQVAAYRSLIPEAEGSGILRLDKETGIPEFKDVSKTHEKDLETFNRMVDLYYARHPRIRKQVTGVK